MEQGELVVQAKADMSNVGTWRKSDILFEIRTSPISVRIAFGHARKPPGSG
jgi:hypothetical protein